MDASAAPRRLKDHLLLIEKHPIVWFFLGIGLALIADGTLSVNLPQFGIVLNPAGNLPVLMIMRLLGFSTAILVLYLYFSEHLPNQRFLPFFFLAIWVTVSGALARHYFCVPVAYSAALKWDYDLAKRQFKAVLSADGLSRYPGRSVLLVVRRNDTPKARLHDTDIVCSDPQRLDPIIRDNIEYSVDIGTAFPDLAVGSCLECTVLMLPPNFSSKECKTIQDYLSRGAIEFSKDPMWITVDVCKLDEKYIEIAAKQLCKEDRQLLIKNLSFPKP